jgi:hypothetical protein
MSFIRTPLRLTLAAVILAATAMLPQAVTATVRYVKPGGNGNGLTWGAASGDLQQMINDSNPATNDEVWVYVGAYLPLQMAGDGTEDRDRAFVLKAGVKIYGGFTSEATGTVPAFGTAGRNGKSTLSGDLGTQNNNSDNAYHVVIGVNISNDGKTVLDGFTVSGGNANSSGYITVNGQWVFGSSGGGIFNNDASPVLTHITISGNTANNGGGIFNTNSSSPVLTNTIVWGNSIGVSNSSSNP